MRKFLIATGLLLAIATPAAAETWSDRLGAKIDAFVRVERDARDTIHQLADKASHYVANAALAYHLSVPDLTILTTEPLPELQKSSGYGWRSDPYHHDRRFHHGTDMRAQYGTPVVAAGQGVVVFAGRQGGYGNVVYIDHGGGIVTRYGHLQKIETKKDATIAAGEELGQVGSTGRATGPHLHFEVRIDGRDVNPLQAMTVAQLQRDQPDLGEIAALQLAPELQSRTVSTEDPHRSDVAPKKKSADATTKPVSHNKRAIKPNV